MIVGAPRRRHGCRIDAVQSCLQPHPIGCQGGLPGVIFRKVTTVLGTIALLAGLAGLIANSGRALAVLVVFTGFLWLTATIWHVLTIGSGP